MANIVDVFRKFISPYSYFILIFVLFVIFAYAGYYAYNTFYLKKMGNKFSDVANGNPRQREVIIYFFHVDWCPHCKNALPEWNAFKSQYDETAINGSVIKCVDMDCTSETADIMRVIKKYNIDSYPTVKMVKDNATIDFDSKITKTSLEKFVTTMTNN
jgi:thiol-disulfide isomerase/thioredoxin